MTRNDLLHVESCALIAVAASTVLPWWAAGCGIDFNTITT